MSYLVSIKKHKFISILFATFLLSVFLTGLEDYSFKKDTGSFAKPIRHLMEETTLNDICKKGPKGLLEYYTTEEYEPLNKVEADGKPSEYVTILIEVIETMDFMKALGYLLRIAPFLMFLLFVLISLISWFVFCCCCCCPCCCCKQKNDEGCCRTVSFVVAVTMFTAVLGFALYSVVNINPLFGGFNGFACSLMKLTSEIINGQEIEKIPKWNGIQGITEILDNSVVTIQNIQNDSPVAFQENDWIENAEATFEGKLNLVYTTDLNQSIENKNPSVTPPSNRIVPSYVTNYGPSGKQNTPLYQINEEFKQRIVEGGKLLNEGKKATEKLSQSSDAINSINSISGTIKEFDSTFSGLETSIIVPMNDILDLMNEYGDLVLLILFSVMCGLSALLILFLILLVICKQNWARFVLLFIWNISTLIMIVLFLVSSLFGIIGVIGLDAVGVAKEILSEENLNSQEPIILPLSVSSYLGTCLHGDGDLSKNFNLDQAKNIDELNDLKKNITTVQIDIEANKNSISIAAIISNFENSKADFLIATTGITNVNDKFDIQLSTLNKKIKDCSIKDVWVSIPSQCPPNYIHRPFLNTITSTMNCFVVSELSASPTLTKYNHDPTIEQYLEALQSYDAKHKEILDQLIADTKTIDVEFEATSKQLINSIENINKYVLDPLSAVFGGFVGNNSVFSIVNCKFMGGHVTVFLDQLQAALGLNFYNLSIILGTMSLCLFFGIIFLIVAINRYKKIKTDKDKEKNETNEEKKNSSSLSNQNNANQIDSEIIQVKK